jgi:hypothetical protein
MLPAAHVAWFDGWTIRRRREGEPLPADVTRPFLGPRCAEELDAILAELAPHRAGLALGATLDERVLDRLEPGRFRALLLEECAWLTAAHLVRLARLGLESLALVGCVGIRGGLEALEEAALRELWLPGCGGLRGRALLPLHRLRSLELLDLRGLATPGLLRWLAPLTGLRHLDLGDPHKSGFGPSLAALEALRSLETLGLRGVALDERLLRILRRLPALRRLDLGGRRQPAAALERLRAARPELELRVDPPPSPPARATSAVRSARAHAAVAPPRPAPEPVEHAGPFLPWPARAPSLAELHLVMLDERGSPCGEVLRDDLGVLARRYDPRALVAALEAGEAAEPLAVLLLLLPPRTRELEPEGGPLSRAVLAATSGLLEDGRVAAWQRDGSGGSLVLGTLAARACCQLLAGRALDADALAELERIVRAGVGRFDTVVPFVLPLLRARVALLLDWLEGILGDRARPAATRIAALELLERIAVRPEGGELARASLGRALDRLATESAEEAADVRFRDAARRALARLDPARLEQQRRSGALRTRSLPPYPSLARVHGVDPARALAAAVGVEPAAVVEALAHGELERVFAACALAPHLGELAEARSLGHALAALCGRRERLPVTTASGSWVSGPLGDLAARQLLELTRGRLAAEACELLELALRAGSARPVGVDLSPPPGLAWIVAALPADAAGARVRATLRARVLDRGLGPEPRFALLLGDAALLRELGVGLLLDEAEDPELRALLGAALGRHHLDELQAAAGARALPVCEPGEAVPQAWLEETLRVAHHPAPVRRALGALVARHLLDEAEGAVLAAGAAELRALELAPRLREVLDAPDDERFGRSAAARGLACTGGVGDEERLARALCEGGWYVLGPHDPPRTALDRLLAVCGSDQIADGAESELAPLLRVGFGEGGARRIEARAYVLLARRHLAAGRDAMALRAARHAVELDPLSLDAQRLLRELSPE